MQSLAAASEEADYLIYIGNKSAAGRISTNNKSDSNSNSGSTNCKNDSKEPSNEFFSIHKKLRELYEEVTSDTSNQPLQYLRPCANLLETLVKRNKLNTLVVKLYPDYKGYTLGYRMGCNNLVEMKRLIPYSEDQILCYIDNEELPPIIADVLEKSHPDLYYSGCVIIEVLDFRKTSLSSSSSSTSSSSNLASSVCDIRYVLLRPTTQSVINDVNLITMSGDWTYEEQLSLESQMVLATEKPLCLDPMPSLGIAMQRIHHSRYVLNTSRLRAAAKRYSQLVVSRKRKIEEIISSNTPSAHLAKFILRKNSSNKKSHTVPVPSTNAITNPVLQPPSLTTRTTPNIIKSHSNAVNNNNNNNNINVNNNTPTVTYSSIKPRQDDLNDTQQYDYWSDVERLVKSLDRPEEVNDFTPSLAEEFILEIERGNNKIYHIKLSIFQRPSNCEYLGQLYIDKDYKDGEFNGNTCRFKLGSYAEANKYIQQFKATFVKEGRKSVKITHKVPGKPDEVTYSDGMRERETKLLLRQQHQGLVQALLQQQTTNAPVRVTSASSGSLSTSAMLIKPKPALSSSSSSSVNDLNTINATALLSPNSVITINGLLSNGTATTAVIANGEITAAPNQVNVPPTNNGGNVINSDISILNSSYNSIISNSNNRCVSGVANSQLHQQLLQQQSTSASTTMNSLLQPQQQQQQHQQQPHQQTSKTIQLSTDPAIRALAQTLMNSAQQFEQNRAAEAAAAAANSENNSIHLHAANNNINMLHHLNSGDSSSTVNNSLNANLTTTLLNNHLVNSITSNNSNLIGAIENNDNSNINANVNANIANSTILSLLNSGPSSDVNNNINRVVNNVLNSSLQQQQPQQQQQQQQQQRVSANLNQKFFARKMTLTNLLNTRIPQSSSSNSNSPSSASTSAGQNSSGNQPVRFSLSTLANQLSSPPLITTQQTANQQLQQKLLQANQTGRLISALPRTVQANVNVQTVANNSNSSGVGVNSLNLNVNSVSIVNNAQRISTVNIGNSNIQNIASNSDVQAIRRLSGNNSGQIDGVNRSAATSHTAASNLGHSMPGLSALLAGTPSADHPVPGTSNSTGSSLLDRITTQTSFQSSSPKSSSASLSSPVSMPLITNTPSSSPSSAASNAAQQSASQHSINFNITGLQGNLPNKPTVMTNTAISGLTSNIIGAVQQQPQYHQQSGNSSIDAVVAGGTLSNSSSSLGIYERLSSPPSYPASSPKSVTLATANVPSPSSSQSSINFNITSLQGAMMSIPGLAVPIPVSINVSATPTHNVNVTSLPVSATAMPVSVVS